MRLGKFFQSASGARMQNITSSRQMGGKKGPPQHGWATGMELQRNRKEQVEGKWNKETWWVGRKCHTGTVTLGLGYPEQTIWTWNTVFVWTSSDLIFIFFIFFPPFPPPSSLARHIPHIGIIQMTILPKGRDDHACSIGPSANQAPSHLSKMIMRSVPDDYLSLRVLKALLAHLPIVLRGQEYRRKPPFPNHTLFVSGQRVCFFTYMPRCVCWAFEYSKTGSESALFYT